MVKVAVQINFPRSFVYSILTDFARYPEWVPGCERCSVTSSSGQISNVEIVLNSMKKITLALRFDAEPDQLLKFELVSSKDVKAYSGSYKLMNATDGGSVLITELELDAGPLAPKFVVDRMAKGSVEATGAALGKHAKTLPPPVTAPAAAKEARSEKKARRPKCLLRVIRTDAGDRIWYGGRMFGPE